MPIPLLVITSARGRSALIGLGLLGLAACHRGATAGVAGSTRAAGTSASVATAAACVVPAASPVASLANAPVKDPLVTFDTAWAIIARTHWDTTYNGVNWRALRDTLRPRAAAAQTTGELRHVLSDMLGRLKQSHFSIIPREVSDATSGGAGNSGGPLADQNGTTGATLRFVDGVMVVTHVPEASAAGRVGVRPGWMLESVSGCPVARRLERIPRDMDPRRAAFMAFSLASQMLAGPVGGSVGAIFRDGNGRARAVSIIRVSEPGTLAKFGNLPPFPASLSFERVAQGGQSIGIIRFNIWMPVLSPQFDVAMDSLRDADAIIVDVRGNFGGVGGMSMGIAGHFLDSAQTIGTMHQRGAALKFVANPRRVDTRSRSVKPFAGPLALLVDELSVSTTEIFAGGMQALGRARVFGTQTSGQALPSVPERLPNGDILYHAIADFLSPTGKPLEGDGVTPDVVTKSTRKALLEGKDPTREAALTWAVQASKLPRKGISP